MSLLKQILSNQLSNDSKPNAELKSQSVAKDSPISGEALAESYVIPYRNGTNYGEIKSFLKLNNITPAEVTAALDEVFKNSEELKRLKNAGFRITSSKLQLKNGTVELKGNSVTYICFMTGQLRRLPDGGYTTNKLRTQPPAQVSGTTTPVHQVLVSNLSASIKSAWEHFNKSTNTEDKLAAAQQELIDKLKLNNGASIKFGKEGIKYTKKIRVNKNDGIEIKLDEQDSYGSLEIDFGGNRSLGRKIEKISGSHHVITEMSIKIINAENVTDFSELSALLHVGSLVIRGKASLEAIAKTKIKANNVRITNINEKQLEQYPLLAVHKIVSENKSPYGSKFILDVSDAKKENIKDIDRWRKSHIVETIIEKLLTHELDLLDAQEELIDAGFEGTALY